jgi:hypothetical protein
MPAPSHNPTFDTYAEKLGEFAKPIFAHLRKLIHTTYPEVIEVDQPNGVRIRVDAFVSKQALKRVLSALDETP